jgi:hypothetical protein
MQVDYSVHVDSVDNSVTLKEISGLKVTVNSTSASITKDEYQLAPTYLALFNSDMLVPVLAGVQ